MRCNYCGTEIKDGMNFCPACGKELGKGTGSADHGAGTIFSPKGVKEERLGREPEIVIEPVETSEKGIKKGKKKEKKESKKGKKLRFVLIFILMIILAIGIGGSVFYFKSSARNVIKQINKGNTTTAQQIYTNRVKNNFIQKNLFKKLAEEDCESVLDQFRKGKIKFEEADSKIDAYNILGAEELSDFLTEKSETLNKLNDSMVAYVKAEKLYSAGNYAEAMEAYSLVIEEDDNYDDAQSKLSKCVENYTKEILDETKQVDTIEEYEEAIETLTIALKIVDDNEDLSKRLDELENGYAALLKSEALSNGTQYIKDGKYKELFELLKKACEKNSGDNELNNLQKTAEEEYVKIVQAKVDEYRSQDQYSEAVKYLNEAVKILENNSTLNELLNDVQSSVPIDLCNMKISESDRYEAGTELSVMEDSVGNVYSPGNLFKLSPYYGSIAYATYYVKGEYTRIKGTIAVADDSYTSDIGKISILDQDGKILYTSGNMSRTTAPKTIDVDIRGAEWITISCENSEGYNFRAFVADWVLFKD